MTTITSLRWNEKIHLYKVMYVISFITILFIYIRFNIIYLLKQFLEKLCCAVTANFVDRIIMLTNICEKINTKNLIGWFVVEKFNLSDKYIVDSIQFWTKTTKQYWMCACKLELFSSALLGVCGVRNGEKRKFNTVFIPGSTRISPY